MNQQKVLDYCNENVMLNIDIINFLNKKIKVLKVDDKGVLVCRDNTYMLSHNDDINNYLALLNFEDDSWLVLHQPQDIEVINKKYNVEKVLICQQAIYLKLNKLEITNLDIGIKLLDVNYLDFVNQNYDESKEYIKNRIEAQKMYGAFLNNQMVGFAGFHLEGSIGLVKVLPDFQRQKIGETLISFLVNKLLEENRIPYSQIYIDNQVSKKLHQKLSFTISDELVYWLKVKKGF